MLFINRNKRPFSLKSSFIHRILSDAALASVLFAFRSNFCDGVLLDGTKKASWNADNGDIRREFFNLLLVVTFSTADASLIYPLDYFLLFAVTLVLLDVDVSWLAYWNFSLMAYNTGTLLATRKVG
ncbi:hypothetical protein RHGRI_018466 [Rhododendron griersonianum]|uniref:Uncharacterized protein n=1 Tax=Rhododendron griersonianum TaxID=479676 RepID=A0AAV6JMJ5_9ERIC|nr:hypothetical protein RHGRI_020937 [Rhododendron griersonianum]KAG5546301.1 hypothetical protein RHGRI_018466 [Rhododendron griersonianum]